MLSFSGRSAGGRSFVHALLLDAKDSNSRYPMGSKLDAMSSVTAVSASRVLSLTS
jgi:hypothetical protein